MVDFPTRHIVSINGLRVLDPAIAVTVLVAKNEQGKGFSQMQGEYLCKNMTRAKNQRLVSYSKSFHRGKGNAQACAFFDLKLTSRGQKYLKAAENKLIERT